MLSFSVELFIFQFAIQKYEIKIHKTVIVPVVLYGCEACTHTEGRTWAEEGVRE